jgi:hypothetical protein
MAREDSLAWRQEAPIAIGAGQTNSSSAKRADFAAHCMLVLSFSSEHPAAPKWQQLRNIA